MAFLPSDVHASIGNTRADAEACSFLGQLGERQGVGTEAARSDECKPDGEQTSCQIALPA